MVGKIRRGLFNFIEGVEGDEDGAIQVLRNVFFWGNLAHPLLHYVTLEMVNDP